MSGSSQITPWGQLSSFSGGGGGSGGRRGRARRAGAYIKGAAKQLSVFYEYAVNIAAGQGRRSAQPALFPARRIQV